MMKIIIAMNFSILIACHSELREPSITEMEKKPLPAFNILLPDSMTYFNTANLSTVKKIILFYYSPSCPYCRAQMREMLNNIDRYRELQLCVLTAESFQSMRDFNNYFKLQMYPNIITGIDTGYILANKYKITSVPFTAVFSKEKRLIAAYSGRITGKTLIKLAAQ